MQHLSKSYVENGAAFFNSEWKYFIYSMYCRK